MRRCMTWIDQMPISPANNAKYPGGSARSQLWRDLIEWVRLRSGNRCEGSPAYPDCRAENGKPHPVTGSIVVLTVAHVQHSLDRNGPKDLKHWCQRCHNTHDAPFRARNRAIRERLERRRHILELEKLK